MGRTTKRGNSSSKRSAAKRTKEAPSPPSKMLEWTTRDVGTGVLVVWPACKVTESDNVAEFFKEAFNIEVDIVGCVETNVTLPDETKRIDFFFVVEGSDVASFAPRRIGYGMRWWEDIFFNDREGEYPPEFLAAYPDPR